MPPGRRLQIVEAQVWYEQAKVDLATAQELLEKLHRFEWACLAAQQAAEKAIKAARIAHGKPAPKDHMLEKALREAPAAVRKAVKGDLDLVSLQAYSIRARYPEPRAGKLVPPCRDIAQKDAQAAVRTAGRVVAACRNLVNDDG